MLRILAMIAVMCTSPQAQITETLSASLEQFPVSESQSVNPVVEWNRTLLVIVRTPGAQPPTVHSPRSFAILHAAIYDSLDSTVGSFAPYLVRLAGVSPETSQAAAAEQAADDVLISLYPAFHTKLDTQLQQDLTKIPDGKPKTDGINIGKTVAAEILAFRANDGSTAPPPAFKPKNAPGFYQRIPPDFSPADFTHWGDVVPFAIVNAGEFLPGPPPALTDKEYIEDLAEVQDIGEIDSKTRTPEQTVIGKFWGGKIQNYWNEIAQTAAIAHHLDLEQSARLFALVNFGMADATISFFEAKYTYNFWRPVTAAELTDTDWLPLSTKTAPDPSYPSPHSATSFAAAEALRLYLGDQSTFDLTSEVLPGVKRHFTSFSAAAREAGVSRIYAGQHYRFDHEAGVRLGRQISKSINETTLLPR